MIDLLLLTIDPNSIKLPMFEDLSPQFLTPHNLKCIIIKVDYLHVWTMYCNPQAALIAVVAETSTNIQPFDIHMCTM